MDNEPFMSLLNVDQPFHGHSFYVLLLIGAFLPYVIVPYNCIFLNRHHHSRIRSMLHGIFHVDLFTRFDLHYTDVFLCATDIKGLTRIVESERMSKECP